MVDGAKLWVALATLTLLSGCKKDEPASRRHEATRERPADVPRPQPSPAPRAPASGQAAPATAAGQPPTALVDALRAATVVKTCALDTVNNHAPDGRPIARGMGTALFQGWAADMVGATIPPNVVLFFESADALYAVVGGRAAKRPDVAEAFKNPVFVDAGFHANVSFAEMTPGSYTVKLFQALPQGGATVCDTGRVITVS